MENQGTKKIFLSYSQSTEKNEKLADDLEEMGHDVWLGQELSQGKWDENCRNIEDCELFIFALDKNSQHSEVCEIEWRYAAELESAILIVNVANDVSERILPAQLANFQTFDYCDYGIESFHDLKKLIGDIPLPGDLPNPLPNLPKAPMSYPNDMAPEKVGTAQNLSHESVKKIFLSYSARSEPAAMILREDIEHMNHEVTLVAVLDGGRFRCTAVTRACKVSASQLRETRQKIGPLSVTKHQRTLVTGVTRSSSKATSTFAFAFSEVEEPYSKSE